MVPNTHKVHIGGEVLKVVLDTHEKVCRGLFDVTLDAHQVCMGDV